MTLRRRGITKAEGGRQVASETARRAAQERTCAFFERSYGLTWSPESEFRVRMLRHEPNFYHYAQYRLHLTRIGDTPRSLFEWAERYQK